MAIQGPPPPWPSLGLILQKEKRIDEGMMGCMHWVRLGIALALSIFLEDLSTFSMMSMDRECTHEFLLKT